MKETYKKTIENLPKFFETPILVDSHGAGIFEPLRQIIDFDEGYIFFLNPDNIRLKYLYGKNRKISTEDVFFIDDNIKKTLFSTSNIIFDAENPLITLLRLENSKSFITLKLVIRNTVYGFVLLCKKEADFYMPEDIDVAGAIGAVISYNIKDTELSEVFKMQLKALQENVVQTKNAFKIIQQQNEKILEADKIKTEFLANVSHELRTPLNAIIGFSEILANPRSGSLTQKQADYVKDINVSGIHLLGMINEILDISKIEAKAMTLNKSEFQISRALDEVVNVVKPLADKKNIIIENNLSEDRNIFADFQKIKQILYNLLSNAIKFTPEKGKIGLNTNFDGKKLIISVKDTGIGIAPEDQKKIFKKFVQLENAYTKKESSTGLGLTITKEFVKMHKGEISIESELNKGAKFSIKLPMNG